MNKQAFSPQYGEDCTATIHFNEHNIVVRISGLGSLRTARYLGPHYEMTVAEYKVLATHLYQEFGVEAVFNITIITNRLQ